MADAAAGSRNHTTATTAVCERQIDSEYKIWKKNTPFLYDFVLTHGLEWPSLTVEWLPTVTPVRSTTTTGGSGSAGLGGGNNHGCEIHQLLIGTHTAGEQNHLMIATSVLPRDNYNHPDNEAAATAAGGGGGVATAHLRYDEEKKEVGGYGLHHNNTTTSHRVGKMEIKMKINHEGEVHRARYMPQNHFIVASRGPAPELYIWDFAKHPSFPPPVLETNNNNENVGGSSSSFCPQAVCVGHTKDGYAMAWSPHEEGQLASGSEDANLLLWDVRAGYGTKGPAAGTQIRPIRTYASSIHTHTATIEDVAWHHQDAHMIGTVADDASLCIWDIRSSDGSTKPMQRVVQAHGSDINCLAFNPVAEFTVATGGADSIINIWDLRNLTKPIFKLDQVHTDQILKVEWAPFNESILGSAGADRKVALWDLSRVGQEQSAEDALDGPPELLFVHGGHTARVSDFSFNKHMDWCVASVAEDNVLQIWTPVEEIYVEGDDEDEEDDEEDEDDDEEDDEEEKEENKETKGAAEEQPVHE